MQATTAAVSFIWADTIELSKSNLERTAELVKDATGFVHHGNEKKAEENMLLTTVLLANLVQELGCASSIQVIFCTRHCHPMMHDATNFYEKFSHE